MTDERPTTVIEAIAAVMEDVRAVRKGDRNESQGFSFRGIDATVNAVGPALRSHGVVVVPVVQSITHGTVEVGRNRTPMGHVIVDVIYRFYGPQGDHIDAQTFGEAMDSGDKATPKAMSVAFRTALLQALSLPTDEPDADAHSYERTPPPSDEEIDSWADGISGRIAACTDPDELRGLWREAVHYQHASEALQARLKGELEARATEIKEIPNDDAA